MTLEADAISARRKLRRSLTVWRVLALAAALFAIVALVYAAAGGSLGLQGDHIARVRIDGMITGDQRTLDMLERIEKSDRARAVIVAIDSPGGTTAGSEAIYESLRRIAAVKPVVATMGTVAASGGYITAIGADYIVARGNTITGSIGVIFQWADVEKLLTTLGVAVEEVKSGDLKAEPNLFGPPSERVLQVTNEMVQDSFKWFAGLVAERRGVPESQIVAAQGRVYTGRQALQEKLVDAIGGEEAALKWLRETKSVPASLEVVNWRPRRELDGFGFGFDAAQGALEAAGLGALARAIGDHARAVELDGLLSLWQAPR